MATQTAEYYESLTDENPYFTKQVGTSVQPPIPEKKGMRFVKFVPSESGIWNAIKAVKVSVNGGSAVDLTPSQPICDETTGFSLRETWSSSEPPDMSLGSGYVVGK